MKKNDLKQLIKPIVKECIHEALIEEGLLSNVVAEVLKGTQQATLTESTHRSTPGPFDKHAPKKPPPPLPSNSTQHIAEYRNKMAKAVGQDAYNGVNLFEGTEPLSGHTPAQGRTDLGDPRDAGVDISSLLGDASAIWRAMK